VYGVRVGAHLIRRKIVKLDRISSWRFMELWDTPICGINYTHAIGCMLLLSLYNKDMFEDYKAAVSGAGFDVVPDECPASVKSLG
jgi:hypothetical protein